MTWLATGDPPLLSNVTTKSRQTSIVTQYKPTFARPLELTALKQATFRPVSAVVGVHDNPTSGSQSAGRIAGRGDMSRRPAATGLTASPLAPKGHLTMR